MRAPSLTRPCIALISLCLAGSWACSGMDGGSLDPQAGAPTTLPSSGGSSSGGSANSNAGVSSSAGATPQGGVQSGSAGATATSGGVTFGGAAGSSASGGVAGIGSGGTSGGSGAAAGTPATSLGGRGGAADGGRSASGGTSGQDGGRSSTGGISTGGINTGGINTGGTIGVGGISTGGAIGVGGATGPGGATCPYRGNVTYTLAKSANPTAAEQDAYARISAALDKAIQYYNCYTDITKKLNVSYVPSVQTADGNINGSMRFGSNTTYMDYRTAMHEIGHTVGIGQASNWASFVSADKLFTGENANAELRAINASLANPSGDGKVHADNQHFWPYGINQQNEVKSEADLLFHCRMVMAIRKDLGLK